MKSSIFIFSLLLGCVLAQLNLMSQNTSEVSPQLGVRSIASFENNRETHFDYTHEALRWEEYLKSNRQDENAWLNYYKALRYSYYTRTSREISIEGQKRLDGLLSEMKRAVPQSFSFNYASYLNGNKSKASFSFLNKAYQQNNEFSELWDDMLCQAVIKKNKAEIDKFSNLLLTHQVYTANEMVYNRNVLQSVEKNGILITNGHVDTYPIVLLQQLEGFRKDVEVVCLEWLVNETYSTHVAQLLGFKATEIRSLPQLLNGENEKSIFLALTLPPAELKKYSSSLYCTGLAMKYSKTTIANMPVLCSNWEKLFDKSTLKPTEEINKNYLVLLVLLNQYYDKSDARMKETNSYLELLSNGFGLKDVFMNHKE